MASTTDRGYGAAHQRERAKWKPKVDAGVVDCWRCGKRIKPDPTLTGDGWDLGHDDNDRSIYRGPEHSTCNRSKTGRAAPRRLWGDLL